MQLPHILILIYNRIPVSTSPQKYKASKPNQNLIARPHCALLDIEPKRTGVILLKNP